ncbi:MAG TPA: hypothetical protein V6D08_14995 [Candidatus Obscuribacterales bacterium]
MNNTDISLQLTFLGVAMLTFYAPFYLPAIFDGIRKKINPSDEQSFLKAILIFSGGGAAQLIVVWLANVISDSANIWLFAHIVAGFIFGGGAWAAALFLPKNPTTRGAG